MSATSTHDTKRGEDARARINVLSEIPDEWEKAIRLWARINHAAKTVVKMQEVPDRNDEYFLYQTLVGSFPLTGSTPEFVARLKSYMIKAVREAKVHTEWLKPDEAYEGGFLNFIDEILKPAELNRFLAEFVPFARRIAYHGMFNSLAQTLIKICSPGVPDFYQGSELWDLNFVDPDNRRPVDFSSRTAALQSLREQERNGLPTLTSKLLGDWENGQVKLYITYKALSLRQRQPTLFTDGDYVVLPPLGPKARHLCAFARRKGDLWCVVVTPRLTAQLIGESAPMAPELWGPTSIPMPEGAPSHWINAITGERSDADHDGGPKNLVISQLFSSFPLALLESI
jgi:(1->4)-alpha-D-glucan 1-alpha-D-glucosylmutase